VISDDELEGLLSLYERGELDPEHEAAVAQRLGESPGARALLASFARLQELTDLEAGRQPELPARVADRVLAEVHASMEGAPEVVAGELPEVLTVEEVARYLRVSVAELEPALAELPFFEFAGRLRMRRESLEAWIEEREQRARRERLMSLPGGRT
jgi:hypothetical protein